MANTLKIKLVLFLGSVVFTIFLALYQNNFYRQVTIAQWRQLTWDDFQGTVKPFTQYDAGIASDIYLESDSANSFRAYAGQNNQLSWVKSKNREWEYGLNHEQYHFNITEVFARKMNQYIKENPDQGPDAYKRHLDELRRQERQMQLDYDNETDHSIYLGPQRLWEYKIDSMLMAHLPEAEGFVDEYTGAGLDIPKLNSWSSTSKLSDGVAIRRFRLKKYGLLLDLTCFQGFADPASIVSEFDRQYQSAENREISLAGTETPNNNGLRRAWAETDTSNNRVSFEAWTTKNLILYSFNIYYKSSREDSLFYSSIAVSLMSSFDIDYPAELWVEKARKTAATPIMEPAVEMSVEDNLYECIVMEEAETRGFLGTQLITNTDTLILPYQIIDVPDSLVHKGVFLANGKVFLSEPESSEHLFKISVHDLPEEPFEARVGYLLKSDSAAGCYQFYNQSVSVYVGGR